MRMMDHYDCLQCDQMAGLLVQYWDIYGSENLPNSLKNCQTRFKILPNTREALKNGEKL